MFRWGSIPSPEPFPSSHTTPHHHQLSPLLTENNEGLSDSLESGGGSRGWERIIVLQVEIFGREKLYCTWIINKLLAHKPSCQATEQTLPRARGQGAAEVICGWARPLGSLVQHPVSLLFTHIPPTPVFNVGMYLLFYAAPYSVIPTASGVARWSLGLASILKDSGFLWDSPYTARMGQVGVGCDSVLPFSGTWVSLQGIEHRQLEPRGFRGSCNIQPCC